MKYNVLLQESDSMGMGLHFMAFVLIKKNKGLLAFTSFRLLASKLNYKKIMTVKEMKNDIKKMAHLTKHLQPELSGE